MSCLLGGIWITGFLFVSYVDDKSLRTRPWNYNRRVRSYVPRSNGLLGRRIRFGRYRKHRIWQYSGMDRAVARHSQSRIIRTSLIGRNNHNGSSCPGGTKLGRTLSGFSAYRYGHMISAHLCRSRTFFKIFRIYGISPGIGGADAGNWKFP